MQASFSVTNEMSPIFDVLSLWVKSDKKIVKSISVVHPKAATRRKKTKRKKKKKLEWKLKSFLRCTETEY